ncbi:MAG: ribonuclease J [Candidatus Altiarchaeales archaeon ex4484_96]|nr:MAG: ribonuclease J [Candidatus Altiarchaeales archaeon ex4484_96]
MKITAVGGYKAVGRNMTGVSIKNETIALDNGIRLDTLQIYDEDTNRLKKSSIAELQEMDIITDPSRLSNIKAQVVSHGHLDHFGAIPIHKPKTPVISTPYTLDITKKEYRGGNYKPVDYLEQIDAGRHFAVELVEVTHSIPYASIVVLHTDEGIVVYAADYRLDNHSLIAQTDYKRLRELGKDNVKALIVESTRVACQGKTPSESVVRAKLRDVLEFIDGGLIVATTFSSHVERIQAIVDEIEKTGRMPVIMGRSLSKNINLAKKYDLIDLPSESRICSSAKAIRNMLGEINNGAREDYFLIVTGHQGEPDSVLSRMIDGRLPFRFQENDSLIFCANVIPTPLNEASRYALETKLSHYGVKVFDRIHVSGHASREDHRYLMKLLKPEHIIPCHGSMMMRGSFAELATGQGYEIGSNVHLLTNGKSIDI